MHSFVQTYGAHPLHLVSLLVSFVVAGFATFQLLSSNALSVAVWFVGAAVLHDLVLLPAYAAVDRLVKGRHHDRIERSRPRPWANYVRVPLALSGMLLLMFLPAIFRLVEGYEATTGLSADGYAWRWLAVSAVLFVGAGLAYLVRGRQHAADG